MLNIDKYYDELPWLTDQRAHLDALAESGRCPHAILLNGPGGIGRRQLALWLIESLLKCDLQAALATADPADDVHPDLVIIEPEADKTAIGVEQIRTLIERMNLTSHQGATRCGVIYPAENMTTSAANSLLKTLEEPAADVVLILICESIGRLPATVISRCQRYRMAPPSTDAGLSWLKQQAAAGDLEIMLEFTGGAPLAALALSAADFGALAATFDEDLRELTQRRADPVAVAARWSKQADLALRWLYGFVAARIREALLSEEPGQSDRIARYFRQLSQIRELRRFIGGGVSAELGLIELLMDWYGDTGHAGES